MHSAASVGSPLRPTAYESLSCKNASFTEQEIKEFFDDKIEKTIQAPIDEKITELLGDGKATGRTNEQRIDLKWALKSIMARIERGMLIEVRFLPSPTPSTPDDLRAKDKEEAFAKLKELAPQ